MRIQRSRTRLNFRRHRRQSGCFPFLSAFLLIVIAAGGVFAWLTRWRPPIEVAANVNSDMLYSAYNAFERGDLSGAISIARQVLGLYPAQPDAVLLLTRSLIYRSYGEYDRAIDRELALEVTTDALKHDPLNPYLHAAYAFALVANGNPASAADVARSVLEEHPDNTLARIALALAYGSVGSYEVALRESGQATAEAVGWLRVDALRALAISQSDMGAYEEAVKTVEQAIELNPALVLLYFERAQYAMSLGDGDAATVAYYNVLVHDENNVKARLRLCELSSLMRERDMATRYCTEVTERAPDWSEGWYRLGMEYFYQGQFAAAQDALNRCSTLQVMQEVPVDARRFECWYIQGQAAEILGDCANLTSIYNEFRAMSVGSTIQERWTYPPEGPPICQ
ncbi:MAG: tetratricopeptide repeat protein [Anaerolinea sp.]|mgnify:CR=1 FL=1|nr:tetratricopeptide repeat protein [Anaerolinea sp.]